MKYGFPLTHVVLDNGELAKISREQLGAIRPVWETVAGEPRLRRVRRAVRRRRVLGPHAHELRPALAAAFAVTDGPSLVAIATSNRDV